MRALTYEMVRDIQDLVESEIRRLGSKMENEREVFNRMDQEVREDEKDQKKIQRLEDVLSIFGEELSVVNFTFGFGGKSERKVDSTGPIYDVSTGENDTENE